MAKGEDSMMIDRHGWSDMTKGQSANRPPRTSDLDQLLGLCQLQNGHVGRGRLVVEGREVGVDDGTRLTDVAHARSRPMMDNLHVLVLRGSKRRSDEQRERTCEGRLGNNCPS
jgi:hypothetical protein